MTPHSLLPDIRQHGTSVRFTVFVQPRASRAEIVGCHGSAIKIRLAAPPVDGAANDALVRFLADILDCSRANVRIVAGTSSRQKIVEIANIDRVNVERVLSSAAR